MSGWPLYDDIVGSVSHGYLIVVVPVEGDPPLAVCPCRLTAMGVLAATMTGRETRARFFVGAAVAAHAELRANGYVPVV